MGAPYLTADEMAALQGLPSLDAEQENLRRQLELGAAMRAQPAREFSSGSGAMLGGIGAGLNNAAQVLQRRQLEQRLAEVAKRRAPGDAAGAKFKMLMDMQRMRAGEQDLAAGAQRMGLEKQKADAEAADRARLDAPVAPELSGMLGDITPGRKFLALTNRDLKSGTDLAQTVASLREGRANRAETRAQRDAAATLGAQKRAADTEEGLRKEFTGNKLVKDTLEVATSYEKVKLAAADPSGASDMTLIFGLMKILDPGSTVREGEYATAQNTGSIPERVVGAYNRALNGQKLDEAVRQDFVKAAGKAYQGQLSQFQKFEGSYRKLAEGSGADPSRVAIDLGLGAPTPATGAPAGGLTPEEAEELKALKARFGGGR